MKKRIVSLLLLIVMILAIPSYAFAATPVIKEVGYEGAGCVEVDFTGKVQYRNLKVTVTGPDGQSFRAEVTDKDDDDLDFVIPNAKPGAKYSFTISGIRTGKSGSYQSVKGSIRIPNVDPLIKEIEYDRADKELEIEFVGRVRYQKLKVTVTDSNGKTVKCTVDEKNSRELELIVKGLKAGVRYTVTISGVRPVGGSAYLTITGTFRA
ncbi:MAG: hypothetical protein IJK35_09360 [Oscillospiraceae bacterium]|nr:hypothetical protein [Oscillospiraceae bacterium]